MEGVFQGSLKWLDNNNSKPSATYPPDFKHKVTGEPLGMDNRFWVHEGLNSEGFLETPCRAALSAAQIDSFVASLRACTRNKDLVGGTSLHHEVVQRKLLKECSDALVTMYAKCGQLGKAKALLDMHKSNDIVTWTSLIGGYAHEGLGQLALDCLQQMQSEGILPNAVTYICALKACATIRATDRGKQIHDEIARQGLLQNNIVLGGALVDMYAKCGAVSEAREVLRELPSRNVVTWNALMSGYTQEGEAEEALNCLEQMQQEGIHPNAVTYVCALKACAIIRAVDRGKQIHKEVSRQGLLQNNIVLGGALVDMYAKCRVLSEARQVLEELPRRNVVSWNALITGYAQEGEAAQALHCLEQMQREGIRPNAVTYVCALKACTMMRAADRGKKLHEEISRQGLLQNDIVLGNSLVDMYAKCSNVSEARQVLEGLFSRDVVSWNALISGYAQEGEAEQALNCLEEMQQEGILPNAVTYVCALKACAMIRAGDKGKQIHDEILRQGLLQNDVVLGGALVDMYAKCGDVSEAQQVISELPSRNVVTWSALIAGYAQVGESEQALNCLEQMQHEGILPDAVTYVVALNACAMIRDANRGKQIHDEIARQGLLHKDAVLCGALVDMYAKCGDVSGARQVMEELPSRTVISWNALITGYTQEGEAEPALNCLEQMRHEGIHPDSVTYFCALKACAMVRIEDKGKQIHDEILRQGLLQKDIMLGHALVDMYAKCGDVSEARRVLEELPSRDVNSWNALIAGYAQEGQAEQALNCLEEMKHEGIVPDAVTCACVLNVCSHRGLVEQAQAFFMSMSTTFDVKPSLECYTCMTDLYGRAGHLEKAVRLIQEMPSSDFTPIWHTLLGACRTWVNVKVGRWAFEQAIKLDKSDGSAYVLMANIYGTVGMEENAKAIEAMRIRNKAWKIPGSSCWIDSSNVFHDFSLGKTKQI